MSRKPVSPASTRSPISIYKIERQRRTQNFVLDRADETRIGVKGKEGYVWVLTSLEEVAYFYTATRAEDTIQEMSKIFRASSCRIFMLLTMPFAAFSRNA